MQWVVEDCLALDANKLAKMGILKSDWINTSIRWSTGANINLTYNGSVMDLRYNIDGEPNPQKIRVSKAQCHFGGHRYYLHCPGCGSRRYRLHLAHSGFYCRECYRLPYYSQECGDIEGFTHQIHKLEAKLENLPKYARTKTVEKLIHRLEETESQWSGRMQARFGLFGEALL
jgi:hypothetical protein